MHWSLVHSAWQNNKFHKWNYISWNLKKNHVILGRCVFHGRKLISRNMSWLWNNLIIYCKANVCPPCCMHVKLDHWETLLLVLLMFARQLVIILVLFVFVLMWKLLPIHCGTLSDLHTVDKRWFVLYTVNLINYCVCGKISADTAVNI